MLLSRTADDNGMLPPAATSSMPTPSAPCALQPAHGEFRPPCRCSAGKHNVVSALGAPAPPRALRSAQALPMASSHGCQRQGLPNTSSSASLRSPSAEATSASRTLSGGRKRTVPRAPASKYQHGD